ncbi:hypothetical protein Vadar_004692 [Vaccinium darrowii]|uniref:Uncharacterized protein n=1 Tax=Vaccinium darrowii TaxID=229202 RepID=A0ACB7ZIE9_9ERIC|nr:hypothetical protein Vadar_004692 [Vaccinium darrowii]
MNQHTTNLKDDSLVDVDEALYLQEIGVNSFPELFRMEGMAQEMAGRILVLQPASLAEFTERCELELHFSTSRA